MTRLIISGLSWINTSKQKHKVVIHTILYKPILVVPIHDYVYVYLCYVRIKADWESAQRMTVVANSVHIYKYVKVMKPSSGW